MLQPLPFTFPARKLAYAERVHTTSLRHQGRDPNFTEDTPEAHGGQALVPRRQEARGGFGLKSEPRPPHTSAP